MKKLIIIVWLAVIGIWCTVPQAEALSCAPPRPVHQEMQESSVVFKGKVIDIKSGGLTVFQVDQAWKGVEDPRMEIYDNGWDPYTKGTEYLVFGSQREGQLRTNLCGRTGPWDKAREEAMRDSSIQPTVLKTEGAPIAPDPSELSEPSNRYNGIIILAGLLLLLIPLFLIVRRRRNKA